MTLLKLSLLLNWANVRSLITGEVGGLVHSFLTNNPETAQFHFKHGIDIAEWVEETKLILVDGCAKAETSQGEMVKAIKRGENIMIHDVDRMNGRDLNLLMEVIESHPTTKFVLTLEYPLQSTFDLEKNIPIRNSFEFRGKRV